MKRSKTSVVEMSFLESKNRTRNLGSARYKGNGVDVKEIRQRDIEVVEAGSVERVGLMNGARHPTVPTTKERAFWSSMSPK